MVTLDDADGRQVRFSAERYAAVDHGYAVTLHKAQGVTVDRAFVLATPGMDRHLAYVGMTRHRDDVRLYYGRDDFEEKSELYRTLGRKRQATTTLDFAERRGIETRRSWFEAARDALGNLGRRLESALEFTRLKERVDRVTEAALQAGRDADASGSTTDRPGAELFARQRQREAERKRQLRPSLLRERSLAKRSTEAQRRLQEQRKLAEKVAARGGASVPTRKDYRSLTEKVMARRVEVGTAPASQPRPGRIVLQKRPMPAEDRSLTDEVAGKRQEHRGPPVLGDLAERRYLAVPFAEKDQAKALGARWDKDAGAWWIGVREDTAPFRQWLDPNRLQTEQDPKLRLQISEAQVKAATAQLGDFEGRHGREADAYEAAFRRCQEQMTKRAYTLARRIDQQRVKERDRFQEQWPKPTPPTGIKALKPGATARYEGQVANWEAAEKARNERIGTLYRREKLVEKLRSAVYSGGALVVARVAREHPELADRGATLKAERIKLDNAKRNATFALRNERDRQQERQRDRSRDQDLEM
ncbi:Ti-type conjugative transfer relaxase TraA [Acidiphilium sp. JA12-A1]|nr:Ti-type conjugative transfer relaxase TraA [Acidiphilium sp. JA12-A1]